MGEFLFELGTEEIPARMAPAAARQLGELFSKEMETLTLGAGEVTTYCTPRRLVLVARGVDTRQADRVEEKIGPAKRVAFDADGNPTKAGQGFARGQGVDPSEMEIVETPKGEYVSVKRTIEGRATAALLPEVMPRIIQKLHFPKSMRWSAEPTPFVRPIHWMIALFDGEVVDFGYADAATGRTSRGHRFLAPATFEVTSADDYLAKIAAAEVVLDPAAREKTVRAAMAELASQVDGTVIVNDKLVGEVVNIVELPIPTLGRFDESFLEIPKEVLISAMAKHQRYFAIEDGEGNLRNAFVVVSNTRAKDQAVVTRGNERVLQARLEDAQFFFRNDRKRSLEAFLPDLEKRIFLKPLGTMHDKAVRVSTLAGTLADLLAPAAKETAVRAGLLAKADLGTHVVAEFPDLQGVMGQYYARLSGEPEAVAQTIFEHYLPRSAEDVLPSTDAGAVTSLADKLDSIAGCFGVGKTPTATQDPYALRRQALGIIRILVERGWTVSLSELLKPAIAQYGDVLKKEPMALETEILEFFAGRLRFMLKGDHASDVVDAVLSIDATRVLDVVAKVEAVSELRTQPVFLPLAAAFKRVVNIVRDKDAEQLNAAALVEPAEKALQEAHGAVEQRVATHLAARDFRAALGAVAELKPAVDAFFDNVMVMADDPALRAARVALLQSIAATFRRIADPSRIQVERS